MKILIDIGHPAHVHYYRNFISMMKNKGHKFIVIARERDVIFNLLDSYNIDYESRGKGRDGVLGKILYFFYAIIFIFIRVKRNDVDILLSHGGIYTSIVGFISQIGSLTTEDTEHAKWSHRVSKPFTSYYLTPDSFYKDLGRKHKRFSALMEWFYLNPLYFNKNASVKNKLGLASDEKYVIMRFVSWTAHHDLGQKGLSLELTKEVVSLLKVDYKVFISSESELPEDLLKYKLPTSPEEILDVLCFANLFISESGTMASEACLLGTKTVYINSLPLMCYLKLEQDYNLLKHFNSEKGLIEYIRKQLLDIELKKKAIQQRDKMVSNFIDPNNYLIEFVEANFIND